MNTKKVRLDECIIFLTIVLVKIIIMGLFSSDYQDKMFKPFVHCFLIGRENPYEYYWNNDLLASFPYFPLMLLIESMGGILLKTFSGLNIFLSNLLFKIPLLVFDLLGYYFIRKLNVRFKYAIVFYFCSPVILYAVYMHGQLDIIPTVLLIIAIYYLLNWRKPYNLLLYALFVGLAISTKFHIVAAVPVLFTYVAKKRNYHIAVLYHCLAFLVVGLFVSIFWGEGFIHTVLFNKEQFSLLNVKIDYGSTQVIIPLLVLIVIYLNVLELNYFNRELLIAILALLFSVFLILIAPMPAWFVWIVPFLTIYFGYLEIDKYKSLILYAIFNCAYVVYFVFFHQTQYVDLYFLNKSLQYLKINNAIFKYMVFTGMVACLAIIIYKTYKYGLISNGLYRRRSIPFSIGIAGDSGSGKSKMIEKIAHLFGNNEDILFIEGDGDHKWERNNVNWDLYTALNPDANYLYRQATDIHKLKYGNWVSRVEYDHGVGLFSKPRKVSPKKYIVLCGLHALYLPQLRKELDLKIYMNTEEILRKYWKIQRDTAQRGYSKEKIAKQIEERLPDAEKYIYPQKQFADIVITYFDQSLKSCYEDNHDVELSVKIDLSINVDLTNLIDEFTNYGVRVNHVIHDNVTYQTLIFYSESITECKIDYNDIATRCIPQYEDLFTYLPRWEQGVDGVIQILLLYLICVKMQDN